MLRSLFEGSCCFGCIVGATIILKFRPNYRLCRGSISFALTRNVGPAAPRITNRDSEKHLKSIACIAESLRCPCAWPL